jgi:hypothetical protein
VRPKQKFCGYQVWWFSGNTVDPPHPVRFPGKVLSTKPHILWWKWGGAPSWLKTTSSSCVFLKLWH